MTFRLGNREYIQYIGVTNGKPSMFADDVTQIRREGQDCTTEHLSSEPKGKLKTKPIRKRIEWKFKTNINKIAVIPVSSRKTHELVIERRKVEYKDKARTLGFKFRRTGYPRGIEDQARRASMQVTKLKRFKAANAKIRIHLYK